MFDLKETEEHIKDLDSMLERETSGSDHDREWIEEKLQVAYKDKQFLKNEFKGLKLPFSIKCMAQEVDLPHVYDVAYRKSSKAVHYDPSYAFRSFWSLRGVPEQVSVDVTLACSIYVYAEFLVRADRILKVCLPELYTLICAWHQKAIASI